MGRKKAIRLLEQFGTIEAVIAANWQKLRSVEGIGKTIAEGIRSAVKEQISPYGYDDDFPV